VLLRAGLTINVLFPCECLDRMLIFNAR